MIVCIGNALVDALQEAEEKIIEADLKDINISIDGDGLYIEEAE